MSETEKGRESDTVYVYRYSNLQTQQQLKVIYIGRTHIIKTFE